MVAVCFLCSCLVDGQDGPRLFAHLEIEGRAKLYTSLGMAHGYGDSWNLEQPG